MKDHFRGPTPRPAENAPLDRIQLPRFAKRASTPLFQLRNNLAGVHLLAYGDGPVTANNLVEGNYIGTDVTGTAAIANAGPGVLIKEASSNTIGGPAAGAGNLISGNADDGIFNSNPASTDNLIQGNLIGTKANGTGALGNGNDGIDFSSSSSASDNVVGGLLSGEGNVIAFNGARGVFVSGGTGNAVLSNSIHSNSGLGIDIGDAGITPNDDGDVDSGPNNLQNFRF